MALTNRVTPLRKPATTPAVDPGESAEAAIRELPERYAAEAARKKAWAEACDSEYWLCLCFASRAEKDAFLQDTGLDQHGDKYIDGAVVAAMAGVELPPRPKRPIGARHRAGSRLLRFVR